MQHHELNGNVDGRVRWAERADIPAIGRLLRTAQAHDGIPRVSELEIGELMTRGEIIVLAAGDDVLAAACLTTTGGHGHLAFLVAAPGIRGAEARVRAIAGALSESESCEPEFMQAS